MRLWQIKRLERSHARAAFDCGVLLLDDWLKQRAGQSDRKDLSRTYVATQADSNVVLGYYAIATHRVVYDQLPIEQSKGLPRIDIPVVLLARLAVDRSIQGQGLGSLLLIDALRRSMSIADQIGIRAVEVDAFDDQAKRFYLKYGFRELLDDPQHLFLPMHEIRKLNLDPFP